MKYKKSDPVRLTKDDASIEIIDQTLLPNMLKTVRLHTAEEIYSAIKKLQVRGAPCIGICAAYGVFVCAKRISSEDRGEFLAELKIAADCISSARPTAVNLSWAVNRMYSCAEKNNDLPREQLLKALKDESVKIHEEDIETCQIMSEFGLTLMRDGDSVLTHCNAGALATSRYGTGLGTLLLGAERGYKFHAYVDETRPLLQGARLTSYELSNAGIETTLICDNMASYVMSKGLVNAVFVGCDRVAVNGDTANKIGTSGLAVLAKHYGVPFYVFCPFSTIDADCKTGEDIQIEMRDGDEIKKMYFEKPIAPDSVECLNPAFDVTPAELITAIVTEKGIFYPPFDFEEEK